MIINKNIWNIILDKLALNKWKNQVKNINQEYVYFFNYNIDLYYHVSNNFNYCINCMDGGWYNKWTHPNKCAFKDGIYSHIDMKKCRFCNKYTIFISIIKN